MVISECSIGVFRGTDLHSTEIFHPLQEDHILVSHHTNCSLHLLWKPKKCLHASSNYASLQRFSLAQFSCSVVSNSLRPHGPHHAKLPCPSPTRGVYSHSCPLSQWRHPTISSSVVPFSSRLPSIRVFSDESVLHIKWPSRRTEMIRWSLVQNDFL